MHPGEDLQADYGSPSLNRSVTDLSIWLCKQLSDSQQVQEIHDDVNDDDDELHASVTYATTICLSVCQFVTLVFCVKRLNGLSWFSNRGSLRPIYINAFPKRGFWVFHHITGVINPVPVWPSPIRWWTAFDWHTVAVARLAQDSLHSKRKIQSPNHKLLTT